MSAPPVTPCPDCGADVVETTGPRLELAPDGEGTLNARTLPGAHGDEWHAEAPAETDDCAYRLHAHQPPEST